MVESSWVLKYVLSLSLWCTIHFFFQQTCVPTEWNEHQIAFEWLRLTNEDTTYHRRNRLLPWISNGHETILPKRRAVEDSILQSLKVSISCLRCDGDEGSFPEDGIGLIRFGPLVGKWTCFHGLLLFVYTCWSIHRLHVSSFTGTTEAIQFVCLCLTLESDFCVYPLFCCV